MTEITERGKRGQGIWSLSVDMQETLRDLAFPLCYLIFIQDTKRSSITLCCALLSKLLDAPVLGQYRERGAKDEKVGIQSMLDGAHVDQKH